MEEVLNGYVTNPTPTLNPNPNLNSNPNRINTKQNFTKSIGRFAGWKKVLTHNIWSLLLTH
jgi:hypothetical protein